MKCSFCGNEIPLEKERIFVDKKGQAHYFCSKKCELNSLKLGRKARKVKWTEDYRKEKAIRMKFRKKVEIKKKEKPEKKKKENQVNEKQKPKKVNKDQTKKLETKKEK